MEDIKNSTDIIHMLNRGREDRQKMIVKAVDSSVTMLTVEEFMRISGFIDLRSDVIQLNKTMPLDFMWNVFNNDIPVYVTNELVTTFGYKGEISKQKEKLMNLIQKYHIPVTEMKNEEYGSFVRTFEEITHPLQGMRNSTSTEENIINLNVYFPALTNAQLKSRPTHILIMPKDLKKLWLVVNTDNGNQIREYVIILDELIHIYLDYQNRYKEKQLENLSVTAKKIFAELEDSKGRELQMLAMMRSAEDREKVLLGEVVAGRAEIKEQTELIQENTHEIENLSDSLHASNVERSPRMDDPQNCEQFVVFSVNNGNDPHYYVMRGLIASIDTGIIRLKDRYIHVNELFRIHYQPNSRNLYKWVRSQLAGMFSKIRHNDIWLKPEVTVEEFKNGIERVDRMRFENL